jgi:hypothetical protein
MRFPDVVLLSACALMLALPLAAQSPSGVINGLVVDSSNHIIAGADILVINDATGVKYSGKTSEDGIYVVPNLPPAAYRLQVSKVGFKTLIKPDIVLNIQDALSINFTLPVGAAFESVTVEGGASMINTTDASVSTVVDQTYVKNMPLNGRSFQDLILLTPGIVTQSPQSGSTLGQQGEFSVNGQRTESNYYTVDGVSANVGAAPGQAMYSYAGSSGSLPVATALGTTQALVSVDDLQEFRVQTSTYSAEFGRSPGGQLAFETKSGTNQWHGSAYDYLRNGRFDAQDWFNDYFGRPESDLRQNDFGGTLGGPVDVPDLYQGKDKTFFFLSYEGLRLTAPQAATVSFVPDATLRANAPSPLSQVLNAYPIQSANGIDDTANGIAQFIGSWSNPSSLDSTSVRLDHVVNDRLRLFFRFSDTGSKAAARESGSFSPTDNTISAYALRTYTGAFSSVLSPRLGNELRLNYSSNNVTSNIVIDPLGGSSLANLRQLTQVGPTSEPVIASIYSSYLLEFVQSHSSGAQRQWNLVDTVALVLGHHQFKFGLDYRRLASNAIDPSFVPAYYYFSENDLETNNAFFYPQAYAPVYPLYRNFSAFAQDEWKVSGHLNLSLGLRWDLNPSPGVTQGLKPYAIQGTSPNTWTLAPQGTALWRTTWCNFAPRIGAAYVLRNALGLETVIRGGGGIFFDTGQQLGSIGFGSPVFFAAGTPRFMPFPGSAAGLVPNIGPPTLPLSYLPSYVPNLKLPYTIQWNGSIEQALGKLQVLTVSYVGSYAARLLQQNEFTSSSNPLTSDFIIAQNGLTSDYDALQLQFRRRLAKGLTSLASYTWSHCLDYGSQNYAIGYQRGNCDFDIRHNLAAAFSYDVPNRGHSGLANAVLRHWGLDVRLTGRTAFPVSLNGSTFLDPTTEQQMANGLDLVSGQPIYLYGANCNSVYNELYGNKLPCPGDRGINPCAFVNVGSAPGAPCTTYGMTGTILGLAPRNFARGFGAWQMDMAVRRDFPIYERLKLQFRAEAFNICNHPNFGLINTNVGQNTFGQATATLASSLGVLNPLYQQGGPRSMQFALKLMF